MNVDATLKRFFPAIVCMALASASYFQASGVNEMLGATLLQAPATTRTGPRPTTARRHTRKSGDAILARNPFDSETGPLDGSIQPDTITRDESTEVPPEAEGDPLNDPLCDFGRVLLIAQADDPDWSFASIQSKAGGSKLRRQGDEIEGQELRFIGWNRVWFIKGGKRCQMKMGDKSHAARTSRRPSASKPKKKRKPRRRSGKVPPEIAKKISRVSDTEFNIERSAVDQILEKQSSLFRRVKLRPVKDGDKVTGLRVSRIRRGSLFETLGMKNGDELRSINGFDLTNPQRALEAYGRLRTAKKLKLSVNRNGSPVTIEFNIQ